MSISQTEKTTVQQCRQVSQMDDFVRKQMSSAQIISPEIIQNFLENSSKSGLWKSIVDGLSSIVHKIKLFVNYGDYTNRYLNIIKKTEGFAETLIVDSNVLIKELEENATRLTGQSKLVSYFSKLNELEKLKGQWKGKEALKVVRTAGFRKGIFAVREKWKQMEIDKKTLETDLNALSVELRNKGIKLEKGLVASSREVNIKKVQGDVIASRTAIHVTLNKMMALQTKMSALKQLFSNFPSVAAQKNNEQHSIQEDKIKENNSEVLFQELKNKTKCAATLSNDLVENAFQGGDACNCPKKGAIQIGKNAYLHANKVENEDGFSHILGQAPQSPIASERFWKTAASTPGNLIIDLTNNGDIEKSPRIASNYPEKTVKFGSMQVKCTNRVEDLERNLTTYTYEVTEFDEQNKQIGSSKSVTRINYVGWMDFSGVKAEDLKKLISRVDELAPKDAIPIVHCRAGVGRSGTFVTARTLVHLSKESDKDGNPKLNKNNFIRKLEEIILNGRESRGPWFVQTKEQVQTLLDFCKELKLKL